MMKKLYCALMVAASISATTATAAETKNGYHMAVIRDGVGTQELNAGDYPSAIAKLTQGSDVDGLEKAMNLCVAYTQSENWQASDSSCNDAIAQIAKLKETNSSKQLRTLEAMAYSNRGVYRQATKDFRGALNDFRAAARILDDPIAFNNLLTFIDKNSAQMVASLD